MTDIDRSDVWPIGRAAAYLHSSPERSPNRLTAAPDGTHRRESGVVRAGMPGAGGADAERASQLRVLRPLRGSGALPANAAEPWRRRRLLKAAVFRPQADPPGGTQGRARTGGRPRRGSRTGDAADPGPRLRRHRPSCPGLCRAPCWMLARTSSSLGEAGSEQRFTLTAGRVAWRGTQLEPAALHQGDHAVVRLHPSSRDVADRIWANIGRVTGIIIERSGSTMLVDEGATKQAADPHASCRARSAGSRSASLPWSPATWWTSSACAATMSSSG